MPHRTVSRMLKWNEYVVLREYFLNEIHFRNKYLSWRWLWENPSDKHPIKITGLTRDEFGECTVEMFDMKEPS